MIQKFKIFEKKYYWEKFLNKYWLINFDDGLGEARLKKIGMSDFDAQYYKKRIESKYNKNTHKLKKIIIGMNDDMCWLFDTINNENDFVKNDMEYMGDVQLTQKDIDKYEFKQDVKKFNL